MCICMFCVGSQLCTAGSMNRLFSDLFMDFLARCLVRMLVRILARSFGARRYSVQFYWDGEIQCTVLPGQRKQTIYYFPEAPPEKPEIANKPSQIQPSYTVGRSDTVLHITL